MITAFVITAFGVAIVVVEIAWCVWLVRRHRWKGAAVLGGIVALGALANVLLGGAQ